MLKKTCLLLSILLFACGAAVFGQKTKSTPQASPKKPRNVVDFLMLLPKNYVGNYTIAKRQKSLKEFGTTDTANGYAEFSGADQDDPFVAIAIFKKDDGEYLVTTSFWSGNEQKFHFLEYDGKKFADVSKKVLPANFGMEKFKEGFTCQLPRYNRTINCRDSDQGKLTYLGWTGKEFVIE